MEGRPPPALAAPQGDRAAARVRARAGPAPPLLRAAGLPRPGARHDAGRPRDATPASRLAGPDPQVQTYEAGGADGQAYLWFALLVLRNAGRLSPAYSMVGGGSAVLLGLLTYALLVEWARHS